MKKILILAFLLVGFTYMCSVSAGIDLQPRNVFYVTAADQLISDMTPGFYVNIQNNGPDDFQGSFAVSYSYDGIQASAPFVNYSGTIRSGEFKSMRLASQENISWLMVDSKNQVAETNKGNNSFYSGVNDYEVRITSSWSGLIAENYIDTLFVLPNEYFYQQFSLNELSIRKLNDTIGSIIGFKFDSRAYGFPGSEQYTSEVQSIWPEGTYKDGNLFGGKYSFKNSSPLDKYNSSCEWMAKASTNALNYFWLNHFYGTTEGMTVDSEAKIYLNIEVVLRDLSVKYDYVTKNIKVIDRIRGDVNDDGVVDQADLDILTDVVDNGLYNPCVSFKNIYQERGINYGAGIVMFNRPDFLSNCLINIWINNPTDPLVQGLGIGELMSKTAYKNSGSPIYGVKNSFSISGEDLSINAPEADLYNVTAQQTDGKLFQATGRMGGQIKVPVGAKNVQVETVKVKQNLTALTTPNAKINVSVYPNPMVDYLSIKSETKAKLQITNLSGQIIYSAPLQSEETLKVDSKTWAKGIYLISINSESGNKTVKVIK